MGPSICFIIASVPSLVVREYVKSLSLHLSVWTCGSEQQDPRASGFALRNETITLCQLSYDDAKKAENNNNQETPNAFFHICPPISLSTLSTSICSRLSRTFRSPAGFRCAAAPSSINMAREAIRESNTSLSSANVGFRVGSSSPVRILV